VQAIARKQEQNIDFLEEAAEYWGKELERWRKRTAKRRKLICKGVIAREWVIFKRFVARK